MAAPKAGPRSFEKTEAPQLLRLRGFCVFPLAHSNCVQNASMVFERPCGDSQVALVDDVVAVEDRALARDYRHDLMNARKSALIVAASVVGIPCGKPLYVFKSPCLRRRADRGAESA